MKNKSFLIIGIIIIVILIILGIVTNYIDSGRVTTNHEPRFCIKTISNDGSKVTYWGLGYKVIRYVGVSPSEPYENNIGTKIGNWFMKYELTQTENMKIEYEGQAITITNIKEIGIIENILVNSKYKDRVCNGINTHKITTDNEVYYIKESCKEIQKGNKQATISDEDLETINNIINNKISSNKISMHIKENTLTNEGMTIIIKNNTNESYYYGPEYYLEKYENGTFNEIEPHEILCWNEVIYSLKNNEQIDISINWTLGYGKLNSGKYRLVKYFTKEENITSSANVREKFYIEFEIK